MLPKFLLILATLVAACATPALNTPAVQTSAAPPPAVGSTSTAGWVERPNTLDFDREYPAQARAQGIGGRAVVECTIGADGRMNNCRVLEENPAGYGFGAAALQLAGEFRMTAQTSNGTPTAGGQMTIPITFVP